MMIMVGFWTYHLHFYWASYGIAFEAGLLEFMEGNSLSSSIERISMHAVSIAAVAANHLSC